MRKLEENGYDAVLIDPLEYRFPLLDRMYKEYGKGEAPEAMVKVAELLSRHHDRLCQARTDAAGRRRNGQEARH